MTYENTLTTIFKRLSPKALAVCLCVTKEWARLIRAPAFRKEYHNRSNRRRRILFAVPDKDLRWVFSLSDSIHRCAQPQFKSFPGDSLKLSWRPKPDSVCGLICEGDRPVVCDPSSGIVRMFSPPPTFIYPGNYLLGYDPDHDEYKLLAMTKTESDLFTDFAVSSPLSLPRNCEWMVVPGRPASVYTTSKCLRGKLYLVAKTEVTGGQQEWNLVQFSFATSRFTYFPLPASEYGCFSVTTYGDKLALVFGTLIHQGSIYPSELHIAENLEIPIPEWRRLPFDINPKPLHCHVFRTCVVGTTTENPHEIIFEALDTTTKPQRLCLFFVNLSTNTCRTVQIESVDPEEKSLERRTLAFDHTESILFLK